MSPVPDSLTLLAELVLIFSDCYDFLFANEYATAIYATAKMSLGVPYANCEFFGQRRQVERKNDSGFDGILDFVGCVRSKERDSLESFESSKENFEKVS